MNLNRLKEIEKNIEIIGIYVMSIIIIILTLWICVLLCSGLTYILLENI